MTNLKRIMDEQNVSVGELSKALNYRNNGAIYQFVSGKRSLVNANFKTVKRIADYLNVDMLDIIEPEELDIDAPIKLFKKTFTQLKNKLNKERYIDSNGILLHFELSANSNDYIGFSVTENGNTIIEYEALKGDNNISFKDTKNDQTITSKEFFDTLGKYSKMI